MPAAAINDVKQALDNPFVVDEGRVQEIELEGHGTYTIRGTGSPLWRIDSTSKPGTKTRRGYR